MKRVVPNDVKCTLSREGASVTLGADDLRALAAIVADGAAPPLSKEAERELFVAGVLVPEALAPAAAPVDLERIVAEGALRPDTSFKVRHRAGGVGLDAGLCGTFGFGLSPLFADAVLQLSGELASSVQLVRRSAESRGRILTTAERRALLERFVRQWVRAHPWTAELFSLRDAGGVLRFELAADRVFRPSEPTAVLELSRAGASEKIEVPASAWPALGAVVDTLHGARRDVAGALREPAARAFVGVLRRLDAVVPARDRLAPFPLQARAGDAFAVTHMGHATLLVDSARHRVLFDPVLYAHDPAFARQPLAASQLANTSAIFVTHHHADHIDAPSLLQLPKHVPIYVPRRSDDPFDPPLAEYVRAWGFERVVEVRPGDTHSFGDLAVTALPFSGEGSDKLGFSGCTYAVAAHGRRAVFLADASPNEDGSSLLDAPSVAALAPRRRRLHELVAGPLAALGAVFPRDLPPWLGSLGRAERERVAPARLRAPNDEGARHAPSRLVRRARERALSAPGGAEHVPRRGLGAVGSARGLRARDRGRRRPPGGGRALPHVPRGEVISTRRLFSAR